MGQGHRLCTVFKVFGGQIEMSQPETKEVILLTKLYIGLLFDLPKLQLLMWSTRLKNWLAHSTSLSSNVFKQSCK